MIAQCTLPASVISADTFISTEFHIIFISGLVSILYWAIFYKIRNESKLLNLSLLWMFKAAFYSTFPILFYIPKYILLEDSEMTALSIFYLMASPFVIYLGLKQIFYKNLLLISSTKNKLKRIAYITTKDVSIIFLSLLIGVLLITNIARLLHSVDHLISRHSLDHLIMPMFILVITLIFLSLSFLLKVEYSKKELFFAVLFSSLIYYSLYVF